MPRLSDTMERGTIARWLVAEGDPVHEGDVLAEIETDKATMELNAYNEGVLLRILVQDGESADLGAPIAVIGAEGEDASGFSPPPARARLLRRRMAMERGWRGRERDRRGRGSRRGCAQLGCAGRGDGCLRGACEGDPGTGDLKASPVARRIASDAGFDLRVLAGKGSGPDGRIVRIDVERAIAGGGPAKAAEAPAAAAAPAQAPAAAERRRRKPMSSSSRAPCCAPSRAA